MKEIIGTAANIYYTKYDKEKPYEPQMELIVVVSEPVYRVDESGELIRQRTTESIRFSSSFDGMKKFAGKILEMLENNSGEKP
jgi:hypothetical protein